MLDDNQHKILKDNRIKQILGLLKQNGEVQINNLCKLFGVTEITIRRDLDDLANKNLLIRTHGGAVLADEDVLVEMPLDKRYITNTSIKESIAKEAFKLISNGMKIVLDSGSTTFFLAQMIPNSYRLAALTNGLNIAFELNSRANIDVSIIGGNLSKNTFSCIGEFSIEMIQRHCVDVAFIGASGISREGNIYTAHSAQAAVKKSMLQIAQTRVLLTDSTKFAKPDYALIANASELDYVITDSKAPSDIIADMRMAGTKIIIVE